VTKKQLFAKLKQIDRELKTLNQRRDGAYEMAVNDRGAALNRVQKLVDDKLSERDQVVVQLRALGV
jgi:hypothetical protein